MAASHSLTNIRHAVATGVQSANLYFAALLIASFVAFWTELRELVRLAVSSLDASHVVLVPPLCAYLIWLERKKIVGYWRAPPVAVVAGTVLALAMSMAANASPAGVRVTVGAVALVAYWIAAFTICYGPQAAYAARFSLLLLLLTVPPPHWLINQVMVALQHASVWCVQAMFRLLHVPAVRHGTVFSLPAGSFNIGPGCSGTRSTIAFLIVSLVIGHALLRSTKSKLLLIASIVPIIIFKNGVRIVTLSLLGYYVDRAFLHGRLHADGGIVFFLFAILLWAPMIRVAQRLD